MEVDGQSESGHGNEGVCPPGIHAQQQCPACCPAPLRPPGKMSGWVGHQAWNCGGSGQGACPSHSASGQRPSDSASGHSAALATSFCAAARWEGRAYRQGGARRLAQRKIFCIPRQPARLSHPHALRAWYSWVSGSSRVGYGHSSPGRRPRWMAVVVSADTLMQAPVSPPGLRGQNGKGAGGLGGSNANGNTRQRSTCGRWARCKPGGAVQAWRNAAAGAARAPQLLPADAVGSIEHGLVSEGAITESAQRGVGLVPCRQCSGVRTAPRHTMSAGGYQSQRTAATANGQTSLRRVPQEAGQAGRGEHRVKHVGLRGARAGACRGPGLRCSLPFVRLPVASSLPKRFLPCWCIRSPPRPHCC